MKFINIYDEDNIRVDMDIDRAPSIFRFYIDNKLYKISFEDYSPIGKQYKNHKKLVKWLKDSEKELLNIITQIGTTKNLPTIQNKLNC